MSQNLASRVPSPVAGGGDAVVLRKRRRSSRTRARALLVLAAPGALVLAVFFMIPVAFVAHDAFSEGLAAFGRVTANPLFWRSLLGSAELTVSASLFSLLVGFAVALHLSRIGPKLRAALLFMIALPLTFSGLIVAFGFILTYGRAGFVTQLLSYVGVDPVFFARILYSPVGLGFASSYYLIPRVVMLLLPVLLNFEGIQIAAAESLGATRGQALRDILIPQILPTAVTACCLVAAVVFGAYGTALALVGTRLNILPLQLYSLISETGGDFPAAAALALLLTAICSSIMAVGEVFAARSETQHAAP